MLRARLVSLLICCLLGITFVTPSLGAAEKRLKIATTFTILADLIRNVAGNRADVVSITKAGADIHGYQPTPSDLVAVSDADLIIWNGLGLELWFKRFYSNLGDVPEQTVSEGIVAIPIDGGSYEGKPNPHAWMAPSHASDYIDKIQEALAKHDKDNAAYYKANAEGYKQELEGLADEFRATLAKLDPARRWIASSEGAFSYLARDFGLQELYIWPINADQQGTPRQIRRVIDKIRQESVPVIFSESTVLDVAARQVASETGIAYGGILYVDSLSKADGPVPTYLDMMRFNLAALSKELSQ